MLPSPGRPVPGVCCPACKAGVLRYSVTDHRLACRACVWQAYLLPAEAGKLAGALSGIAEIPAVIAAVAQRVAVVDAPPEQGAYCDGALKWHVVPHGPETVDEHLGRLTEQAELNSVQVQPRNREHTEFRVSSQRRGADGKPVCWYEVRVSAWTARCSCPATKPCAHLAAVSRWLEEHCEQPRKDRAQIEADGAAARRDLWGS